MKKLFSKTFAMLLASSIVFSSTGYSTYATSSSIKTANVVNCASTKEITGTADYSACDENSTSTTSNDAETSATQTSDITDPSTTSTTDNINTTDTSTTSAETGTVTDTEGTVTSTDVTSTNEASSVDILGNTTSIDSTLEDSTSTNTTDKNDGEKQSMISNNQSTTTLGEVTKSSNEASQYSWNSITFGQSTDLNFQSTILPDKIGTQYANETQISIVDSTITNAMPITHDAVVIESRGGKIANAHDGLTYYYTTLPTDKNFVLEAKVFINQFGPENGSTPSKQEATGIMARDVISVARQDPMIDGYEELPAASNTAVTMILANEKKHDTALNISSYQRNGVFYPNGNSHISYSTTKFAQVNADKSRTVTQDITPDDGVYDSNDFFTLRLERTNDGFTTTYIDATGNETTGSIDDADRLAVIDKDNMYIGFFSSRNAKVTYTDIYLETSDANTAPCSFTPASYDLDFTNLSNLNTSSSDYTVAFRANFDGVVDITKDGLVIESAGAVTAGKIYELSTTLTNSNTDFVINYTSSAGAKLETFTVVKNEAYKKDLYASVDGLSSNTGDLDSPLDIGTALNYLSEGYTLYLKAGTYGALNLSSNLSGSSKGTKTLAAYNKEDIIFSGNSYVYASYWNIKGISITGSNSAGLRAYGNSNTFDSCTFYNNQDTGFQLGTGSDSDPLMWPEDNLIINCTSYNNIDPSGINADGFAAKLGVGTGNVFDSCISHDNADDGWDLFNKLGDAKNEPVIIQNCVAYANGNNGFKLGGEGYAVDHVVTDCFAFANNLDGFTCNFNTGVLTITNCTSVDNARYNYIFRLNPYKTVEEQGFFTNNVSFRSNYDSSSSNDYISGNIVNSYFFNNGNTTVTSDDFVSVTAPTSYERNADGTINFGDYMRPTPSSFLASSGVGGTTYLGAIKPIIPTTVSVTGITLNNTSATLKMGETLLLSATVAPSNANNASVNWSSSNPAVASVDGTGTINALGVGNVVITATANDGSNISADCTINVETNIINISSITLDTNTIMLAKSGISALAATVSPSNATNSTITWTSSDSNIATVDTLGNVTGKSYGSATVTAVANDGSGVKTTCQVNVGYKIKYKLNKGINNDSNPAVYYNQKVTLSAPSRKGYTFKGWYTDSKFKTKITSIKKGSKKDYTVYAKWEKITKPASPVLKSITNSSSKKMKVTLESSVAGAKGYEITYTTNKKFKKDTKTVTISKSSTTTKTIKQLTNKTTYYVKARAYKVDSAGNKIYSKYSKTMSVKINK